MAEVIKTTFKLKRGTAARWQELNPVLQQGEPGFVYDTYQLKIGDGVTAWNDLPYIGGYIADGDSVIINDNVFSLFGFSEAAVGAYPRKGANGQIEWVIPSKENFNELVAVVERLEALVGDIPVAEQVQSAIKKSTTKYEVSHKPTGTLVDYREKEVRIMCPKDTEWTVQNVGPTGDKTKHYLGFKAYAPEGAFSFKEDLALDVLDNTRYYFTDNDFAGIDPDGCKYSIFWLAAASLNDGVWTYYGASSTSNKYIGWYYTVEWYDEEEKLIGTDTIRINLSNEYCHYIIEDYYMGEYQKKTDSISIDRLINSDDTVIVLNGGSAPII